MLNIKTDIPVKEDLTESLQNIFAQIRDLLIEAEQQLAFVRANGDYFLTKKEVAEYFHCEVSKIPRAIPRLRRGNDLLFKKSDIDEYVKMKTRR